VNISLTPSGCSVLCPRDSAQTLFAPVVARLRSDLPETASISTEDYSAIHIGGEGLEAGQRVLDLTSPLALAGIPIFFITSYYCDYIIVPHSARARVIHALEEQGFVFEADPKDGEAGQMTNPASPLLHPHHRHGSSSSSIDFLSRSSVVGTPPPTNADELQARTFKTLAKNNISPLVDPTLRLITCAGMKDSNGGGGYISDDGGTSPNTTETALQHSLILCFTATPPPRFLSITLNDNESTSLTLEKDLLLRFFPDNGEELLLGNNGPEQIPIILDLKNLPLESTGIVCGVAGRLNAGMRNRLLLSSMNRNGNGSGNGGLNGGMTGNGYASETFNLSYLSTAKAGHVIVYEHELEAAMAAFRGGWEEEMKGGCL
jgi:cellobiose dehydrogenase (acceptor)